MENTNPNPEEQKEASTYNPVGGASPEGHSEFSANGNPPAVTPVSNEPQAWAATPQTAQPLPGTGMATAEDADHSYLLSVAFSYFFGSLGVDRFYLGYTGTGILKLLTLGGLGIWHLVDMLLIAFGKKKAKGSQLPLEGYAQHHKAIRMVAIVLLIVNAVVIVGVVILLIVSTLGAASLRNNARNTEIQYQSQRLQSQQNSTGSSSYYTN